MSETTRGGFNGVDGSALRMALCDCLASYFRLGRTLFEFAHVANQTIVEFEGDMGIFERYLTIRCCCELAALFPVVTRMLCYKSAYQDFDERPETHGI